MSLAPRQKQLHLLAEVRHNLLVCPRARASWSCRAIAPGILLAGLSWISRPRGKQAASPMELTMLAVSLLVSSGMLTRTSVSTKNLKGQKVLICQRIQMCDFSDLVWNQFSLPLKSTHVQTRNCFFDSSTAKYKNEDQFKSSYKNIKLIKLQKKHPTKQKRIPNYLDG